MRFTYYLAFSIAVAMSTAAASAHTSTAPAEDLVLQDGDTIVFVGDELTDTPDPRRNGNFPVLVETFLTVRYPGLHLR